MGKPRIQPTISFVISFIPAWAGKTRSIDSRQDSKHSSSPLTRGKHDEVDGLRHHRRLTPAHAGKTSDRRHCRPGRPAHPRSRGENPGPGWYQKWYRGSSPLTRGKPDLHKILATQRRLIPAHAGKTRLSPIRHAGLAAHPRSRGENAAGIASVALTRGSSPLTRGKHILPPIDQAGGRLIPAHAGKTCGAGRGWVTRWAHPRSRGENLKKPRGSYDYQGSSPLTRGKRRGRPGR